MTRRHYRLEVPLSQQELNTIKSKAIALGLSASAFARLVLLNSTIKELDIDLNGRRKV